MRTGRIIIAGVVAGILKAVWGFVTCGWLFNWVYALEPTNIWKPVEKMPFVLMNVTDIIFAIILALVYALIYKGLPGRGIGKGLWFGLFVWLVGGLPGTIALGMVTTMAAGVVIYWTIDFLALSLWQGAIIAAIYGKGS